MRPKVILILIGAFIIALYLDTHEVLNNNEKSISWQEHLRKKSSNREHKDIFFANNCNLFSDITIIDNQYAIPARHDYLSMSYENEEFYGKLFTLKIGTYDLTAKNPFNEKVKTTLNLFYDGFFFPEEILSIFYSKQDNNDKFLLHPYSSNDTIYIYYEGELEECFTKGIKIQRDSSNNILVKMYEYTAKGNIVGRRYEDKFSAKESLTTELLAMERLLHMESKSVFNNKEDIEIIIVKNGVYQVLYLPRLFKFPQKMDEILQRNEVIE